jgi:hypothetical protein
MEKCGQYFSTNSKKQVYNRNMIVTVEVIRDGAFSLLSDMEGLDLIRINTTAKKPAVEGQKLSEQFAGALHLSNTGYETYQKDVREGRNEWTRGIY